MWLPPWPPSAWVVRVSLFCVRSFSCAAALNLKVGVGWGPTKSSGEKERRTLCAMEKECVQCEQGVRQFEVVKTECVLVVGILSLGRGEEAERRESGDASMVSRFMSSFSLFLVLWPPNLSSQR